MRRYPLITRKRRLRYPLDKSTPAWDLTSFLAFRLMFDYLLRKFAVFSKPPIRDDHQKESYPKTQQFDQGSDGIQDHASRGVVQRHLATRHAAKVMSSIEAIFLLKPGLRLHW